jgi:hypothetical protein
MRDKELALEILRQIEDAAEKTITRFKPIGKVADFTDSPAGVEKMDKIPQLNETIKKMIRELS